MNSWTITEETKDVYPGMKKTYLRLKKNDRTIASFDLLEIKDVEFIRNACNEKEYRSSI